MLSSNSFTKVKFDWAWCKLFGSREDRPVKLVSIQLPEELQTSTVRKAFFALTIN